MTLADRRPVAVGDRTPWTRVAIAGLAGVVAVMALVDPVPVLAALVSGILNTAAGGGAIVTFLALTAIGVPALTAHATSQLVTPATFIGAAGLVREHRPATALLVSGCLGTVVGVAVLKVTPPGMFAAAAPFVLVPAAVLVVVQEPVKHRIGGAGRVPGTRAPLGWMFGCGVYGGLVGVGTGTLALVVLGLTAGYAGASPRELLRSRNVLLLGMAVLVAAAFAATGLPDWGLAAQLAPPSVLGGWLGGKLVGRLPIPLLQAGIVVTAMAGAAWLAVR